MEEECFFFPLIKKSLTKVNQFSLKKLFLHHIVHKRRKRNSQMFELVSVLVYWWFKPADLRLFSFGSAPPCSCCCSHGAQKGPRLLLLLAEQLLDHPASQQPLAPLDCLGGLGGNKHDWKGNNNTKSHQKLLHQSQGSDKCCTWD